MTKNNTNGPAFEIKDILSIEKIRGILLDLEELHGLALTLLDSKGDILTIPEARAGCSYCLLNVMFDYSERCRQSDREHLERAREMRKPHIYRCYSGLNDIVVPIYYKEDFIGAIVTGQIRFDDDPIPDFVELGRGNAPITERLKVEYENVPVFSRAKVDKIASFLFGLMEFLISSNSERLINLNLINRNRNYNIRQIVQMTKEIIEKQYRENITLEAIATRFGQKASNFSRMFKEFTGTNFKDCLLTKRLEEAKRLLILTDESISDISYSVGFSDSNHFSIIFKKKSGESPMAYRKRQWKDREIEVPVHPGKIF